MMIDLHTHILPEMDDGAGSADEALRMTEALYRQKVEIAVCTPHFDPTRISLKEFLEKRERALSLLEASRIILRTGCEVSLHDYLFHYPDITALCIENTDYLLVELPYAGKWEEKVYGMLEQLIHYYNLIPIIAHIERYRAARKRKTIKRLREMGCLLQLNTSFILDGKGWRRAARLLKRGFIDVVASDCHNMDTRPPVMKAAYDRISEKLGRDCCDKLMENARNIADGLELKSRC
jgi:protein-tyrosine phosphatase